MTEPRDPNTIYGLKPIYDLVQSFMLDDRNFDKLPSGGKRVNSVKLIKMIRNKAKDTYTAGFEDGVERSGGPNPYTGPRFVYGTALDWEIFHREQDKSDYYIDHAGHLWVRSH